MLKLSSPTNSNIEISVTESYIIIDNGPQKQIYIIIVDYVTNTSYVVIELSCMLGSQ